MRDFEEAAKFPANAFPYAPGELGADRGLPRGDFTGDPPIFMEISRGRREIMPAKFLGESVGGPW